MADVAAVSDAVFRIFVAADIERVWQELTRTDGPQPAVFNACLHVTGMAPGERMQMRSLSGRHVLVVGEIVEFDPPRRFAHTHRFTQHDDPVCTVVYELEPVNGGVEVTLRVLGLPAGTATAKSMSKGGTMILNTLKAVVERGRPPFGTRVLYAMFKRLEFVLPARTRSEHWPL